MKFYFTNKSFKQYEKLPEEVKIRIEEKLNWIKQSGNLSQLKPVKYLEEATHRLRIGNMRLLIKKEDESLIILKIRLRKDIYR